MHVFDAISARYSVRRYEDRVVEPEKLERIMEAARLAPSASNRQEWRFVVARDHDRRQQLMEAASNQEFVGEAPVVIVACAKTDGHVMRCGQLCYTIDVAIALEHIALQAVEEGLGTCWIGSFDEVAVKELLGIPATDDVRVVELMTLGYPADGPNEKSRLQMSDIVMEEVWRE